MRVSSDSSVVTAIVSIWIVSSGITRSSSSPAFWAPMTSFSYEMRTSP